MMKKISGQTILFAVLFLLLGCQDHEKSLPTVPTNTVQIVLDKQKSEKTNEAVSLIQSTQPSNTNPIRERLETSYARVSANQNDVCPKLVDFQVDSKSVVRQGEKLNQHNYCEYFVFLNQGDNLTVTSTNGVQAHLVAPEWFNFSNGKFTAKKFDRYTIRLSYDGTRYRPQNFVYDISISKNIDKP